MRAGRAEKDRGEQQGDGGGAAQPKKKPRRRKYCKRCSDPACTGAYNSKNCFALGPNAQSTRTQRVKSTKHCKVCGRVGCKKGIANRLKCPRALLEGAAEGAGEASVAASGGGSGGRRAVTRATGGASGMTSVNAAKGDVQIEGGGGAAAPCASGTMCTMGGEVSMVGGKNSHTCMRCNTPVHALCCAGEMEMGDYVCFKCKPLAS